MPELISPDPRVRVSYVEAMDEFAAEDPVRSRRALAELRRDGDPDGWRQVDGFATYVASVLARADENVERADGIVASTTRWWVDGDTYLGQLAIRHRLTPWLLELGGHIGYDIRPTARRRGHATAMLAAALPLTHSLGIDPALITCDTDNVGSRKVIESAGGVFEDERGGKLRYWVRTRR